MALPLPPDLHLLPRGLSIYAEKNTARGAVDLHSYHQRGASVRIKASNSQRLILVCCEAGNSENACPCGVSLQQVVHSKELVVRSFKDTHICLVDFIPARTMLKQRWFVALAVSRASILAHS